MGNSELMIGDWINLNYDINYKTGELIYAPVQVTGINSDGTIDVNFTYDPSPSMQDGWDMKLVEPIPLTPEILEKNRFHWGFTSNDEDLSLSTGWPLDAKDEHWCLDEDECDGTIEVWFPNESDYGMIDVLNGYTHEFNRVVKEKLFVHTLQHALYECGLRQKIEL